MCRNMTMEQARNYVLAGFFPETPEEYSGMFFQNSPDYPNDLKVLRTIFLSYPENFIVSLLEADDTGYYMMLLARKIFTAEECSKYERMAIRLYAIREKLRKATELQNILAEKSTENQATIDSLSAELAEFTVGI